MPTIIDGCNVLGHLNKLYKPRADQYLIEDLLLPYLKQYPKKMVLVFDNADYNTYTSNNFKIGLIRVRYVLPRIKTADDVIIDMIKTSPDPKGFTIVTSDRAILDVAKLFKCKFKRTEEFLEEISEVLGQPVTPQTSRDKDLDDAQINEINQELYELWGKQ